MAGDQGAGRGVSDVPLVLVAAVARNGIIGVNGGLPWRLSSDLKRFKVLTWGKPLLMGRKTSESIGRALPGRETIVVTRDPVFLPPGVFVAHDLDAGLALAAERARAMGADEIDIVGGGEIYAQTIARATRLFITEVALDAEGEARFPPIDPHTWREISRETGVRGPRDDADYAFVEYERRIEGDVYSSRAQSVMVSPSASESGGRAFRPAAARAAPASPPDPSRPKTGKPPGKRTLTARLR
jgi:dihydrofolate reductase